MGRYAFTNPSHAKVQAGFITPAKGTKLRKIALLMMRPEGITSGEAWELNLIASPRQLMNVVAYLSKDAGFDVDVVGRRKHSSSPKSLFVYRIFGRHRWNGEYRSFVGNQKREKAA